MPLHSGGNPQGRIRTTSTIRTRRNPYRTLVPDSRGPPGCLREVPAERTRRYKHHTRGPASPKDFVDPKVSWASRKPSRGLWGLGGGPGGPGYHTREAPSGQTKRGVAKKREDGLSPGPAGRARRLGWRAAGRRAGASGGRAVGRPRVVLVESICMWLVGGISPAPKRHEIDLELISGAGCLVHVAPFFKPGPC